MGFINRLRFNNSRDAPKLPDIRDDVRDSGTVSGSVYDDPDHDLIVF